VLGSEADCQLILIPRMFRAFQQYGPRRALDDLIDHAIGTILWQLGVEQEQSIPTSVNKYRQRRRRNQPTPSDFAQELYSLIDQYRELL
jgi:hypothetical protein